MANDIKDAPMHEDVIVGISNGDGTASFMIAHRVDVNNPQSFNYYSPEHGDEFELHNVVDWHPLP